MKIILTLIFCFFLKFNFLHTNLRVFKNTIINQKNETVILKGVNKSGTEFMCIFGINLIL
jgi:uncharacterized protein YcgI (DUF1989 family)